MSKENNSPNYPRNDSERAVRFAHTFGSDLRHVAVWDSWFKWDKTRWKRETNGNVVRLGQTMSRIFLKEAFGINTDDSEKGKAAIRAAVQSGEASEIRAMLSMACVQPAIAAEPEVFDNDPFLLCVRNGVVDLRTGAFRESQKEDHCTKQAGVTFDKDARCPLWTAHLNAVFAGNESLVNFFQCAVGYSLTGDTREHKLFFLYGRGSNGKSTTMETIQHLLGDYARKAPDSLFMLDHHNREPQQEIAELMGKRFVIGSEIEEGGKLAESRVKDMTGGDTLTGRFLYSRSFNFTPTHKLWIFGNHKPDIANNDEGVWRRMCLIPFTVEFKDGQKDPQLKTKLRRTAGNLELGSRRVCALAKSRFASSGDSQHRNRQLPETRGCAGRVFPRRVRSWRFSLPREQKVAARALQTLGSAARDQIPAETETVQQASRSAGWNR
jgi:putative DNA primase/helicase